MPIATYIDLDEADELCIKAGWYICDNTSIKGSGSTLLPFTSRREAEDEIASLNDSRGIPFINS